MLERLRNLVGNEEGQDLIEYALLAGLLAIACIAAILQLSRIREFFTAAGLALQTAP